MRIVHKIMAIGFSVLVIFIALITSFDLAAYGDFSYYEKEYEKYNVKQDLHMEMDDIMEVTEYMMSYLKGQEEVLSIETTIEGRRQDFFNEQDRLHMKDVQDLFLGGLRLRNGAAVLLVLIFLGLLFMKADWKCLIPKLYQKTLGVFLILIFLLSGMLSQDFTKYFTIFHEIFFDNDLWIFDPATDYMIRMLPEGFFYDMVVRIGLIFVGILAGLFALSVFCRKRWKKEEDR